PHGAPRAAPPARRPQMMYTGVPTGVLAYRSMTSGIVMRTQPCDALWPIVPYSLGSMPCMPAPPSKDMKRALSGSAGPGGITLPASEPAQALFGTYQGGSTCFHLL